MPALARLLHRRVALRPGGLAWALVLTVLVAFNLRAAVTSLGPVLPETRTELGLSAVAASVATTAPVLCFGLLAFGSPWLARRVGLDRAMALSVVALLVGLLLRPLAGQGVLILGTVLSCAGIAVANVLLPAVVKDRAPDRIGAVTGAYTASLALGSAAAAAVTAPLAESFGVRVSLWAWVLPAVAAVVVWVPYLFRRHARAAEAAALSELPVPEDDGIQESVWRSPVGWSLAVLFGTQAIIAYVTMGWLPTVMQWRGDSANTAGLVLAVAVVVGVPVSAVVPTLAARRYSQAGLVLGLTACATVGFAGITFGPVAWSWVFAAGIGIGNGVFPLTLTLFNVRARSARETQALSAMGQGVGYLLAAPGPFLFGVLGSSTGSWVVPTLGLLGVTALQGVAGVVAGRPRRRPTTRNRGGVPVDCAGAVDPC